MKTLPKMSPGDLIRLALSDLEKAEKSPHMDVDMNQWVRSFAGGCAVCFAGGVMVGTLGCPTDESTSPGEVADDRTRRYLRALDGFRLGHVSNGLYEMDLVGNTPITEYVSVAKYADDPDRFKADMRRMADDLDKRFP